MTAEQRRQQQLDEVRLLRASVGEDEFVWRGFEEDAARMARAVVEEDGLEDDGSAIEFGLRLHSQPELWLIVEFPQLKGDEAAGVRMYLTAPDLGRSSLEQLKAVLATHEREAREEGFDNVVFDSFTAVQSYLSDHPELVETAKDAEKQEAEAEAEVEEVKQKSGQVNDKQQRVTDEVRMARVIFWTHHLKAPSKKRDMASWCAELDVWGLVKSGYPGFLCFEGQEDDVGEMVRRIKALQWHAITVKTDERYGFTPPPGSADDNANVAALLCCRLATGHTARPDKKQDREAKVRPGMDEVESIKELLERLEMADVPNDEYQYALALRTKRQLHADGPLTRP
ncbi:hypothetical protein FA10DRAFT_269755 [Acaromyces ingoldii]|uniref:Small nuclear ribonucleoprotein Prp3 C-terminal domain-containing protein n=1 Tax=Acaromyces ingoldii TaxID=215250 RepID=A0A316YD97_9BASI|nr:hypothetical protein FA10DRAFT_269755 [Acaromyces ingoldii]PWN87151.1 hypothetical protein FA10DRAFT_269755 [Acaromyces ingoldii]